MQPRELKLILPLLKTWCRLFGGEGFILQRLKGDGLAFVHAGGTLIKRDLASNETVFLDTVA